jgi:hypothetical protein
VDWLPFVTRAAARSETAQVVLGFLAGAMARAIELAMRGGGAPRPASGAAGMWRMLLPLAALAGVVLAAVVTFSPALFERVAQLETPYLKVQFATSSAEKDLVLRVDRDIVSYDKLEDLPQSLRFISYDCGQAALDAGGMARLPAEQYRTFQNVIAFRKQMLPYVNSIVDHQRKGWRLEILKARVKVIAEKFEKLVLSDKDSFAANYKETMDAIERQIAQFKNEGASTDLAPEEKRRLERDDDPHWCDPPEGKQVTAEELKALIDQSRGVYGFVSGLFGFIGDSEGDVRIMSLAQRTFGADINVNSQLAASLYVAGRDYEDVFRALNAKDQAIEKAAKTVNAFVATSPRDDDIKRRLLMRYERARFIDKVHRAYLWAQRGLDETWPRQEVPWHTALTAAKHAYDSLAQAQYFRFPCIDDDWELEVNDTYAFVVLAFEAYKLQAYRKKPSETQIGEARAILEDLRAQALDKLRDVRTPRRSNEPAPTCLIESEAKAWLKRLSSHIKLADAMLSAPQPALGTAAGK